MNTSKSLSIWLIWPKGQLSLCNRKVLMLLALPLLLSSSSMLLVYTAPTYIIGAFDFICTTYLCTHPPHAPVTHLGYIVYMPNLLVIFISSTHLAVTCEVDIVVGLVLANIHAKS